MVRSAHAGRGAGFSLQLTPLLSKALSRKFIFFGESARLPEGVVLPSREWVRLACDKVGHLIINSDATSS